MTRAAAPEVDDSVSSVLGINGFADHHRTSDTQNRAECNQRETAVEDHGSIDCSERAQPLDDTLGLGQEAGPQQLPERELTRRAPRLDAPRQTQQRPN